MSEAPATVDINVYHVTRVEGHGNVRIRATDGKVEQVQWQVPEAPRFFEAMVRGRRWDEMQTVTCRICGICSFAHSLASLKAVEDAMEIPISEQTRKLRVLALHGEQLESHFLHVGYLVAPDLAGAPSVVPLVDSHPKVVKAVIRLHKVGNDIMEMIGGRRTHPMAFVPGGFRRLPGEADLREIKERIEGAWGDVKLLTDTLLALADRIPSFERPTEYIALVEPGSYAFYDGTIGSTDTTRPMPVQQFKSVANEYVVPQSTAKWAKWHRDSYMVGALARFNLSYEYLMPGAVEAARAFGLTRGVCNPFLNSIAQVVEAVQVMEHAVTVIDDLLAIGIKPEKPHVRPRAGWGVGAVEAPRGVLFHNYAFDENGICTSANLVIPTNQNHANIQKDMEALVPQIVHESQDRIRLLLEMLVRAYDPCISCSTHYLDVEFA
jgi:sulfhydrogenase subunit alpha